MLSFSIFLILVLFANILVTTRLEKNVTIEKMPQKTEVITSNNYILQVNTSVEQESNIFSYLSNSQNNLVTKFY